jgi:RadC-like JAB domain
LIKKEQISVGILNEALAHPREILKPAIVHSAYAFALVHNLWAAAQVVLCGPNAYVTWRRLRGAPGMIRSGLGALIAAHN